MEFTTSYKHLRDCTHNVETSEDKEWNYKYKVGDEWTDSNGIKWKKTGEKYRSQIYERKISPIIPIWCPKCEKSVTKADEFYIVTKGYCLDCDAKVEFEGIIKEMNGKQNGR